MSKSASKNRAAPPAEPDQASGAPAPDPFPDPVVIPIEAELDLHTFSPRDLEPLLEDYLEACREQGLEKVKIIHGKGTGQLKERVRHLLKKNPLVLHLADADPQSGGWGATTVTLKQP